MIEFPRNTNADGLRIRELKVHGHELRVWSLVMVMIVFHGGQIIWMVISIWKKFFYIMIMRWNLWQVLWGVHPTQSISRRFLEPDLTLYTSKNQALLWQRGLPNLVGCRRGSVNYLHQCHAA